MKKIFLSFTGILSIFVSEAQNNANNKAAQYSSNNQEKFVPKLPDNRAGVHQNTARTTAITIAEEDFSSGTDTTLPIGWTAGIISGTGTWHWTNAASTSTYSMGPLLSTTASNGWMIFDSDSIGTACTCAPAGWLQSRAYDCSSDSFIQLNFEEYFERLYDSCEIWVSTDNAFTSYTRYPVALNNSLLPDVFTANPATVHINISSAAGMQTAVYIRFVYYDEAGQTGGYSWMIDDMSLTGLNKYDVNLNGAFVYMPAAPAFNTSIFTTPLSFIDSVNPIIKLSNSGDAADSNVIVSAIISNSAGSIYSDTAILTSVSLSTTDSNIKFPSFLPTTADNYTCAFFASFRGDSITSDNYNTVTFNISDTIWNQNSGPVTGSYYINETGATPVSYFRGVRFDAPPDCVGDTLTGFGVSFSSLSSPTYGANVSIQLYSATQASSSWTYMGSSVARPIVLTDISPVSSTVWAYFATNPFDSAGLTPFILRPGKSYAAVIQTDGVTTDLAVDATAAPAEAAYTGYFGLSDTSDNDGSHNFNPPVTSGLINAVPLIQLYFGTFDLTRVNNVILTNFVGPAYPDPANSSFSIPFTMSENTNVTVTLMDMVGQVVSVSTLQASSGQAMKATFTTDDLPSGLYIYSVEAGGQLTNGRIAITH